MEYRPFERQFIERTLEILRDQWDHFRDMDGGGREVTLLLNCLFACVCWSREVQHPEHPPQPPAPARLEQTCQAVIAGQTVTFKRLEPDGYQPQKLPRDLRNALAHADFRPLAGLAGGHIETLYLSGERGYENNVRYEIELTIDELLNLAHALGHDYLNNLPPPPP